MHHVSNQTMGANNVVYGYPYLAINYNTVSHAAIEIIQIVSGTWKMSSPFFLNFPTDCANSGTIAPFLIPLCCSRFHLLYYLSISLYNPIWAIIDVTKSAHLFQPVPMTTLWCPQITAPSEDIHHSPPPPNQSMYRN